MTAKTLGKWFKECYPRYSFTLTKENDIYKASISHELFKYNGNIVDFVICSKNLNNLKKSISEYMRSDTEKIKNFLIHAEANQRNNEMTSKELENINKELSDEIN